MCVNLPVAQSGKENLFFAAIFRQMAFRVSARLLANNSSVFESASEWLIKASGYRKYGV
jgi:hypothetical protein